MSIEWDDLLHLNAGQTPYQENTESLFLTSSFTFKTAAEAQEKFATQDEGHYLYSRFSNPTITTLNQRFAAMEGAECSLSVSSGMAAINMVLMGLCQSGDKLVCGQNLFGATTKLLSHYVEKLGLTVVYVASDCIDDWQKHAEGAKLFFLETPSNPMQIVVDIAKLAKLAKASGALLVVDNCFCAGIQKPLQWGADLVVQSCTKYPDGQGRVIGGNVAGKKEIVMKQLFPILRMAGLSMSPFNAWLISRGLETLRLRMRVHSESALKIATELETMRFVKSVLYTGLASHPKHELAMQQQNNQGSGIVTMIIKGGKEEAWCFIDSLKRFTITANFGDSRSIVTHPSTTTHQHVANDIKEKIGLNDSVIRLSIGLEPPALLMEDIRQALRKVEMQKS